MSSNSQNDTQLKTTEFYGNYKGIYGWHQVYDPMDVWGWFERCVEDFPKGYFCELFDSTPECGYAMIAKGKLADELMIETKTWFKKWLERFKEEP